MKPLAYLAGPLGFTEGGRLFQDQVLIPAIADAGFKVLNPWTLTPEDVIRTALDLKYGMERKLRWREVNFIIGGNNAEAIQRADVIVAVLDGPDVDSGTAAEIGFACALGKPILGYRTDLRQSGDNEGSTVNLQVEYFIGKSGGLILESVGKLKEKLLLFRSQLIRNGKRA
jgi:nucleoside 2-deoxyribosyltransferase